jgi:hypothetical protein
MRQIKVLLRSDDGITEDLGTVEEAIPFLCRMGGSALRNTLNVADMLHHDELRASLDKWVDEHTNQNPAIATGVLLDAAHAAMSALVECAKMAEQFEATAGTVQ